MLNCLAILTHPRVLRSADELLLEVPGSKRKLRGDRAFSMAAPNLWNNLPLHISEAPSLSIFKTSAVSVNLVKIRLKP